MKRTLMTVLCAALLLCGCRISNEETFNPTLPGLQLAISTLAFTELVIDEVNIMRALDTYITTDESERDAIQDSGLSSYRVVERADGVWQIIGDDLVIVVYTNGKSLRLPGAKWNFEFSADDHGTLENKSGNGGEQYALHIDYAYNEWGEQHDLNSDLTLTYEPYGNASSQFYIFVEGGGTNFSYYGDYSYRIMSPLRFDTARNIFDKGSASTTCTYGGITTSPEFEIDGNNLIVRGGKDNAYTSRHQLNY